MSIRIRIVMTVAVLMAALAAIPAPPAEALVDCTPEFGAVEREPGVSEYRFRRCGVPDFDQLRTALPNGGLMYCAPASAVDWMVYLAERGAASVMPGRGIAGNYAQIDQTIASMGTAMSTDANTGTEGVDAIAAMRAWFDQSYGGQGGAYFNVWGYWRNGEETIDGVTHYHYPSARSLAAATANGSLVMPNIGWYAPQDGRMARTGGHVVALASAHPDLWTTAGAYTLGFVDPGSGDGNTSQQGPWTVDPVPARPTRISTAPFRIEHLDKLWAPGYSAGYLEGGYVITPKFALLPDPGDAIGERMTLRRAVQLDEGPGDRVIDALDGRVVDVALGADGAATTAVLDDGRIVRIDNVDGSTTTTATIPGATNLVVDDRFRTAVIDRDGRITILDRHHRPVTTVDVPGATGLGFSQRLEAFVTFDSPNQELVVLPEAIPGNPVEPRRLPIAVPEGPPITPEAALSVNPSTGVIGLLEPGANTLTRAVVSEGRFVTTERLALGAGAPLEGLVADATGAWYTTRSGRIVAFDHSGTELADNPFTGQPSAPVFEILQPMSLGTPPAGPNVMPQDAPRIGDQLSLSQVRDIERVGDTHEATATLGDAAGVPLAGRLLGYAVDGVSALNGTVTTNDSGGAVVSWTAQASGDDSLTVWEDRDGDGVHDPAEPAASITMSWTEPNSAGTSTALASSANPSRPGHPVTFTATVSAPTGRPAGSVRFAADGQDLGPPVPVDADGRASQSTRTLPPGLHRIQAAFAPADGSGLLPSTAQLDQMVGVPAWTPNLIRNPGADQSPGSPTGDVVRVPEWNVDWGGFTAVEYGAVDPRTGLPFPAPASGPPDAGANFFAGGPDNGSSVAVQIISLPTEVLASVDAGTATYRFAGWLGGYETQNDLCEPVLLFTANADGTGDLLGRDFLIGGQAADRGGATGLLPYETYGQVPSGARSAHVVLQISRTDGFYNDGYCDSLELTVARTR